MGKCDTLSLESDWKGAVQDCCLQARPAVPAGPADSCLLWETSVLSWSWYRHQLTQKKKSGIFTKYENT